MINKCLNNDWITNANYLKLKGELSGACDLASPYAVSKTIAPLLIARRNVLNGFF